MRRRRILVLFADEWDRTMAARHAGGHEFAFEGFDLFRFPGNARLFSFDIFRFVDRLARRYGRSGIDGIVTSDEQFGPVAASLLAERLGLAHTPLEAVLAAQHKYYARQAFERELPCFGVGETARIGQPAVDLDQAIELRQVLRRADAQQRIAVAHRGLAQLFVLHAVGLLGQQLEVVEDLRIAGELAIAADRETEVLLGCRNGPRLSGDGLERRHGRGGEYEAEDGDGSTDETHESP